MKTLVNKSIQCSGGKLTSTSVVWCSHWYSEHKISKWTNYWMELTTLKTHACLPSAPTCIPCSPNMVLYTILTKHGAIIDIYVSLLVPSCYIRENMNRLNDLHPFPVRCSSVSCFEVYTDAVNSHKNKYHAWNVWRDFERITSSYERNNFLTTIAYYNCFQFSLFNTLIFNM